MNFLQILESNLAVVAVFFQVFLALEIKPIPAMTIETKILMVWDMFTYGLGIYFPFLGSIVGCFLYMEKIFGLKEEHELMKKEGKEKERVFIMLVFIEMILVFLSFR